MENKLAAEFGVAENGMEQITRRSGSSGARPGGADAQTGARRPARPNAIRARAQASSGPNARGSKRRPGGGRGIAHGARRPANAKRPGPTPAPGRCPVARPVPARPEILCKF